MNTSEVLNRAADLIEERGWVKGGSSGDSTGDPWGTNGGALCLEGGIFAAMGYDEETPYIRTNECAAGSAVREYLCMTSEYERLYDYNDTKERTAAEVIEVLRACALIEAAREEQDAAWETYAQVVTA